ncbi:MAG: hypothetical protein J5993_01850 [Clostridia bacterium]|nr:hypothetical protein [Clostridia bacterium]
MRIYFFSETPCALFSSGLLLGRVDGFERSFDAELSDKLFIEIVSQFGTVGFFLNRDILVSPPPFLTVYVGEILAIEYVPPCIHPLSVLAQREENGLITLFLQNGLFLSIEREEYHLVSLPLYLKTSNMTVEENGVRLSSKDGIAFVGMDGTLHFSYPLQNGKLYDVVGREILISKDGRLSLKDQSFPKEKLLFAFLESVRLHEDLSPYLSEELSSRKQEFLSFFPAFERVIPYGDGAAILLRQKENVYKIKPVFAEYKDGKIDNVKY